MDRDFIVRWIKNIAEDIKENKDILTSLDTAIGDGDHGFNMDRGFSCAMQVVESSVENDIGLILKSVGMSLISSVGGASGPLYGTFFLRAATEVEGKTSVTEEDISRMIGSGTLGLMERGRAQPGDKTIVDVLYPVSIALKERLMGEFVAVAEEGLRKTIPLLARKGRASYLGERSVGHQDPGATSACIIIKALQKAL
jgi:phosphoenolpyruvate---glycerone phosphotransferase subunit DhaL